MGDMVDPTLDLYEGIDPSPPSEPREYTCKFCKRSGLVWLETKYGWRLSDPSSRKLHSCKA